MNHLEIRSRLLIAALPLVLACADTDSEPDDTPSPNMTDAGFPTSSTDAGFQPTSCDPLGQPLLQGAAPFARGDTAFAYDGECARVYMFFGDKAVPQLCSFPPSDFVTEGWYFDLNTGVWSKLTPEGTAPTQRARASGAWDSVRKQYLVFGGRYRAGTSGPYTFLNDLWSYSPETNQWTELSYAGDSSAPRGRMNTEMIFDEAEEKLLIFGGGQLTSNFSSFIPYNDLFSYDLKSNTWEQITPNNNPPPARLFHSSAFDAKRRRLYIFGGGGASAFQGPFYNDMWYFDFATKTWTEVPTNSTFPARRIKAVFVYDAENDRLVMMGGHDDTSLGNTADVWSFDLESQQWNLQIAGDEFNKPANDFCDPPADFATYDANSPERRESHIFTYTRDGAFLFGGRTDCGVANDTWLLNLDNYSWETLNESISGMTCYRSGRTDCDDPGSKMCG